MGFRGFIKHNNNKLFPFGGKIGRSQHTVVNICEEYYRPPSTVAKHNLKQYEHVTLSITSVLFILIIRSVVQ